MNFLPKLDFKMILFASLGVAALYLLNKKQQPVVAEPITNGTPDQTPNNSAFKNSTTESMLGDLIV